MSAESLAGWGSVVVLLHELLWWGGVLGCTALVVTSTRASRRLRSGRPAIAEELTPHDSRVLDLRRELTHAAAGSRPPVAPPLDLASSTSEPEQRRTSSTADDLVLAAGGCSAAAAGVHLAMAPLHTGEGPLQVGFFVVVGLHPSEASEEARRLHRAD